MPKAKQSAKRILKVVVKRMLDDSPDTCWLGEYSNRPTSEYSIDRAHSTDCIVNHGPYPSQLESLDMLHRVLDRLDDARTHAGDDDNNRDWESFDNAMDTINQIINDIEECDCGDGCDADFDDGGQYRYFNPSLNYVDIAGKPLPGNTPEEVRKYVRQDYERMERLNAGDWCFISIKAEAEIAIASTTYSNGESDFLTSQVIHSGGSWGIESDSERSYLESEENNQLAELKTQLKALGFSSRAIATAFKNVERESD